MAQYPDTSFSFQGAVDGKRAPSASRGGYVLISPKYATGADGYWGVISRNEKDFVLPYGIGKTILLCTPNRKTAHFLVPGVQTKLTPTAALKFFFLLGPKLVFKWFPVLYHKYT